MVVEKSRFTKEQICLAERREGYYDHPVLGVIETCLPFITSLNERYQQLTDNQERLQYADRNYRFLADALVAARPFTLEPLEMVAVWSRAREVFPTHRYRVAGMISNAFAVQAVDSPEWRKFPRYILETGELPKEITTDEVGIRHTLGRLDEITDHLRELSIYSIGTTGTGLNEVIRRMVAGDETVQKELDELARHQKEHKTLLLGELDEEWGNGIFGTRLCLMIALEKMKNHGLTPRGI